ncbi:MAG: NAD(P)-dependent oxidoreductase [Methylococcaceae bacterium]|nr:NAD(P)-dependent oxidoreductase [Methylococcaceae bacterium]
MFINNDKILITGGSGFIGTNLIDLLLDKNYILLNFDKSKPHKNSHEQFWHHGNLLSKSDIENALYTFKPTVVIHLAARTDTLSDVLDDYIDNTKGTENLISCLENIDFLRLVVITSTQYVYKSDDIPLPPNDTEYRPYTIYGQSKVITEQLTRASNLRCSWTIVRPANIWGPWHLRYPQELWRIIDKGLYVHPCQHKVIRTYGYVKNVAYQILQILESDSAKVDKKTFYLGDEPIDSYVWLNAISRNLRGKTILRAPGYLFTIPALVGDLLLKIGIPTPLYTARFKNMIEDYIAPTDITVTEFGVSHPSLEENVKETISWIQTEGKEIFEYWKNKS